MIIVVAGLTADWVAVVDKNQNPITLSASVVGAHIYSSLKAFKPVLFTVTATVNSQLKILPMPSYIIKNSGNIVSIDIGEIIAGATLEIALPSGAITIKETK